MLLPLLLVHVEPGQPYERAEQIYRARVEARTAPARELVDYDCGQDSKADEVAQRIYLYAEALFAFGPVHRRGYLPVEHVADTGDHQAQQRRLYAAAHGKAQAQKGHEHAQKHLEGYHHILQTDGYQAYEKLEGITHMGCWAHCRRKYKEALDSAPAGVDLKQTASYRLFHKINKLFQIEKENADRSYEEIMQIRQVQSKPLVDDFFEDVRECAKVAVDKTKLSEALKYSINQEEKLRVYLEDGRIEISNNRAENAIRPFCVGRRNWLFTNTVQGAQTSAALYSLIETAKLNNLNPYEYFNYLLSSLTEIDINDEEALDNYMPWSKELPDNTYLTKKS